MIDAFRTRRRGCLLVLRLQISIVKLGAPGQFKAQGGALPQTNTYSSINLWISSDRKQNELHTFWATIAPFYIQFLLPKKVYNNTIYISISLSIFQSVRVYLNLPAYIWWAWWPRGQMALQEKRVVRGGDENERITNEKIWNREWRVHSSFGRDGRRKWARGGTQTYRFSSVYISMCPCIFQCPCIIAWRSEFRLNSCGLKYLDK